MGFMTNFQSCSSPLSLLRLDFDDDDDGSSVVVALVMWWTGLDHRQGG